jgi:hypothetical protein
MTALSGGAVWYYNSTQAQIMQLTANNATLKSNVSRITDVNAGNVNALNELEMSFINVSANYESSVIDLQDIRKSNSELRNRLGKHEIGVLAAAKPKLVERIINNASNKAFRCFEIISGAPLTDNEMRSKDGKSFNSECPWLYNSGDITDTE